MLDYEQDALEHQGYTLVRGFFSEATVTEIQAELDRFRSRNNNPTLAEARRILDFLFSESLLRLSSRLLGCRPVLFADIQINALDFWSRYAWHKDSVDRCDATGPDWQELPYPVLRFGSYFQDYSSFSGAVSMQPGSHRGVRMDLPGRRLVIAPGDLGIWYLTTNHSANTPSFRWRPDWAPVPPRNRILNRLSYLVIHALDFPPITRPRHAKRQVVFFSLGRPGEALARYLSLLLHRRYFYQASETFAQTNPLAFLSARGYRVLDLASFRRLVEPDNLFDQFEPGKATQAAERLKGPILDALQRA